MLSPLAGKRAIPGKLLTMAETSSRYFGWRSFKDPVSPFVSGTSGKRGTVGPGFCELHTRAGSMALAQIIRDRGFYGPSIPDDMLDSKGGQHGPVIIAKDVRFVSDLIQKDVVQVLTSMGIPVVIQKGDRPTPTPVLSFEILRRNAKGKRVEGIKITASHNPPDDAGLGSSGFEGGPNTYTKVLDERANEFLKDPKALMAGKKKPVAGKLVSREDLMTRYVRSLKDVVRMHVIRRSRMKFGVTPIGGAACGYYEAINKMYGLNFKVFFGKPDPAGKNRTYDWDGRLRGDPTSEYVMQVIAGLLEKYGLAAIFANDNDADRHAIKDSTGLVNPNHVLCVIFDYLCRTRGYKPSMGIGRSIATTHMLDAIAASYGRPVYEKNVGFKYYVDGLRKGMYVMAGEESAGLEIPRLNGKVWVTEKDGIVANLLMAEIMAATGKDIGTLYKELEAKYGAYQYGKIDSPATDKLKSKLAFLSAHPEEVTRKLKGKRIAGRKVTSTVIGDGVKVVLEGGIWVLFRASGTEDIIKVYMEEKGDNINTATKAMKELQAILGLA